MVKVVSFLFVGVIISILVIGCHTDPDLSATPEVSFQRDIQPILGSNCTMSGCHNDDNSGGNHDDDDDDDSESLTTYNDVMDYGEIVAGNAHRSKLYRCITNRNDNPMPPNGWLATEDIQKIYIWIEQGAKNN